MLRSSLIAASATLLCGVAAGQSSPLNWQVHNGPIKFGGTYHMATGKWTRSPGKFPGTTEGALKRVYDNTCLWTGLAPNGIVYNGMAPGCETIYDEGRIPGSADPTYGANADDSNLIEVVTFAHVTFATPGTTDVTLDFWDFNGGDCIGGAPNTLTPTATLALNSANGITLPGDPTGTGTTWFLAIDLSGGDEICIVSEGTGVADGMDKFTWAYTHQNANSAGTPPGGGPVIAGEPLVGTFGTCTYDVGGGPVLACGSDAIVGPCGTGLGGATNFWSNTDGDVVDGATNTSTTCSAGAPTACFSFGSWPNNPWGSYFFALDSAGPCGGTTPAPSFYCTGKTATNGCIPFMSTDAGTASVSATGAWNVRSNDMIAGESGFGFFGFKKANLNFHGGKLCVKAPFTRTPIAKNKSVACINPFGGCTTTSCRQLRRNFNITVQNDTTGLLTAGQVLRFQMRQRDPADPLGFGDTLSDGVNFTIAP